MKLPLVIDGITTKQLTSWLGNGDGRLQQLEGLGSGDMRMLMNERATCQTYYVESFFSVAKGRAGFKPGPDVMNGMLTNIFYVAEQRSMHEEQRLFTLPEDDPNSAYGRSRDASCPLSWNDGTYRQHEAARRRAVSAAATTAAKVKVKAVREHHSKPM